ncbi:MAG: hypothetical protein EBU93_04315 [Chlamydiae bacterium]|nr:hypothetical protein [Chlamydiota bacterium]
MLNSVINRFELQPGQWITFEDFQKPIPNQLQGPFKVINRNDAMLDPCRCFLMNLEGNLLDYCPRLSTLADAELPFTYFVRVQKIEKISEQLGEKFQIVQEYAIEHVKGLSRCKYFEKGFDPTNDHFQLTGLQIREKYNLTLIE